MMKKSYNPKWSTQEKQSHQRYNRSIDQRKVTFHHHGSVDKEFRLGPPSSPDLECDSVADSSTYSSSIINRYPRSDDSRSAVDFERRITDMSMNNDMDDDESVGVNRHKYSPDSIRRILDQQEQFNAALCQKMSDIDQVDSAINRSAEHSIGHSMNACGIYEAAENSDEVISSAVTSTFSGATGFFKRWMKTQRIKRQKEALEKAVEEQRKKLIRQSLSQLRRGQARYSTRGKELETCHEDYASGGLHTNETFKNVTSDSRPSAAMTFCGVGDHADDDDDDYSYGDESRENFDHYMNAVRGAGNFYADGDNDDDDDDGISYDARSADERDSAFMIGHACQSVSGSTGFSVQLEILDKPKNVDSSIDSQDEVKIQMEKNSIPFILSHDQMKKIGSVGLPPSTMFSTWKRLYCLQRDGDSFTTSFLRKVSGHTRTLLVIQTTKNEVMGGYSNSPWESQGGSIGAAFYGSCQASLFKIDKNSNEVFVYNWTGHNRYVQVCDIHAKLLAFGGGGKDGSFGLCVEDDFSVGTTGRCETFDNDPLCEEGRFEILNVECWGFVAGF